MGLAMALFVGMRFEVGADWLNYLRLFERLRTSSLDTAVTHGDPGYQLVSWVVASNHWKIWPVNLVCGVLLSWGLVRFSLMQPFRWIALAVAIPYIVIVVGMGYSRQGAALGIILAGLASYFRHQSVPRYALYVALAATFHATAVFAFLLVAMTSRQNRLVNFIGFAVVAFLFYNLFIDSSVDRFYGIYIKTGYSSQGALVRVAMDASAALVFFVIGRRLAFSDLEYRVWRNFAFASFAALIALAIIPSSTAVDRLAIYLLPLQIAVFARFPIMAPNQGLLRIVPIALFAIVQFVWFNYAQFASFWLPYQHYSF
jgi:hypothetical protein